MNVPNFSRLKENKIIKKIIEIFFMVIHKIAAFFSVVAAKVSSLYYKYPVLFILVLAHLLNFLVEIFSRHSIIGAVKFIFANPLMFEYSVFIIIVTLSLSLFFKRRAFALCICSLIWLVLGIINFILLFMRITPLAATDFQILNTVFEIIPLYLSWWLIILLALAILALIVGIVFLGIRSKKKDRDLKRAILCFLISGAILASSTAFASSRNLFPNQFENLPSGYREYGFVYCFCLSMFDRGIDEPQNYSEAEIDEILADIGRESSPTSSKRPNVIFLQLESFFDTDHLVDIVPSQQVTPVFSYLKENFPSGYLTVPAVGAGTANTEFEILSGMSLDYFGTAEYPYKTLLDHVTCETINYNLKELGYSCHAIHNHRGAFYDRNNVFKNLGFDTFTSVEYMQNLERTPNGWVKDYLLLPYIFDALNSTEGQDMIYTISVQAHGRYPTDPMKEAPLITATGFETEEDKNAFEYYFTQINEMDAFLGNLINELSHFDEDTVLVLYGDHLPNLDLQNEQLDNGNVFQTEYIVWSNFGLKGEDCDLYSYQLSAHIMEMLGFNNGVMTKLHQNYSENPNYLQAMEMIEYDTLYGELESYGGENPYKPTDMRMGINDIKISGLRFLEGAVYVTGTNFTNYSVINVDGDRLDTKLVNNTTLRAKLEKPTDAISVCIEQVEKNNVALSASEMFIYHPDVPVNFE